MVVLQNIVLKKLTLISFLHFSKSRLLLKYFLNKKIPFCLSDFAKHLEKPFVLQNNHMAQCQTYALRQWRKILKSSFFSVFPVFLNLNGAKFNNLRLLLNRCQSLCQKRFVCVLINLSYNAVFKHVASENGPLVLIL